jgi:L-fuconolactonase
MKIDAHQHFWRLARGDYAWPSPDMTILYRDYGPEDFFPHAAAAGIERSVIVQATPTVAETHFLLEIAGSDPRFGGVVGWVPLEDAGAPALLAELARNPGFRGVRPMLQSLPQDDWIVRPDLTPAVEALTACGLGFDALVFPRHLPYLRAFAQRHGALSIVIDHAAKPRIGAAGQWQAWADDIASCAALPNVCCKLSGLPSEAGPGWSVDTLRPYVRHLLDVFGPDRLMWGSDWPVVEQDGGYAAWRRAADVLLGALPDAQRAAIDGETARRFYRL